MEPYVSGLAYIPRALVSPKRFKTMRKHLLFKQYTKDTVKSTGAYAEAFSKTEATVETARLYALTPDRTHYTVPRRWALKHLSQMRFADRTVSPRWPGRYPAQVTARDANQRTFFASLEAAAQKSGPQHVLANATTGSGKSVAMIRVGQALQTPTLIVVDSNKIAAGFLRNFEKFFGKEWTAKNVGRVQQGTCDYEGKAYVLTLVQSLISRRYPDALYRYFGLVAYDEVQVFGNATYHAALGMFSARVHMGFTATNKTGEFGRAITSYLGEPAVVSTQKVMEPRVTVVAYKNPYMVDISSDGALINGLVRMAERNALLAQIIYKEGYLRQRKVLVMSERIAHLQTLMKLVERLGVPASKQGLHVGEYDAGHYTVAYSHDGLRSMALKGLALTRKEANNLRDNLTALEGREVPDLSYMPKALVTHYKRQIKLPKDERVYPSYEVQENTIKPTEIELDRIVQTCDITYATKQIFSKGVDYPQLDFGVEAAPIGNLTQPLGRVLRLPDGFEKKTPEWYSIYDRVFFDPTAEFGSDDESTQRKANHAKVLNAFFTSKHKLRKKAYRISKALVSHVKATEYLGTDT